MQPLLLFSYATAPASYIGYMRIAQMQAALRDAGLDGWLFFDHHFRDPLAYRILQFKPAQMPTRRWYYLVPASGEPRALCHMIEPEILRDLPGGRSFYAGWRQQKEMLAGLLKGCTRVAMQYSPECAVPYVAMVDAGTIELVRGTGVEIATAADLIQSFEAVWSEDQYRSHKEAQVKVDAIRRAAFQGVASALRAGKTCDEFEVQQFIRERFQAEGLITDHGPIVAVNANASNPHYEPTRERCSSIREGDLLLIDLWAKLDRPGSVYYDITWSAYCGRTAPDSMKNVFSVVREARDAAVSVARSAAAEGRDLAGFQVDDAARGVIGKAGFGEYFFHRTGHSIGEEVHGNGANMDNYETHDARRIIPGTCFSVEPGIYLKEFGMRTEVNVFRGTNSAEVTGEIQTDLIELLA